LFSFLSFENFPVFPTFVLRLFFVSSFPDV